MYVQLQAAVVPVLESRASCSCSESFAYAFTALNIHVITPSDKSALQEMYKRNATVGNDDLFIALFQSIRGGLSFYVTAYDQRITVPSYQYLLSVIGAF